MKAPAFTAVRVYVEGGGDSRRTQEPLREGFARLFSKVLDRLPKPRVIACGSRSETFSDFCTALETHRDALCLLLVDSEEPVLDDHSAWEHVRERVADKWMKPDDASDDQLHFMAQTMEAWLLTDIDALEAYYGRGFRRDVVPAPTRVEKIAKPQLYEILRQATADTKTKGRYEKSHGFVLIGAVDPLKVRAASQARRFFDELTRSCKALKQGRR